MNNTLSALNITPSPPRMCRVAIYIRVSTLQQVDKDSLPMQRKDLIAYSKLILNTDDYVIFEDAGYSGKNTIRPRYQDMMDQIRTGAFTHLLVWKIDRISRNLLDFAQMYQELKELNVTFVSKNEQFNTSTAMGEAMLKIILVFAELERNMTSERVTATMISRANTGKWNGGRVPYGYKYDQEEEDFLIIASESNVVKLIHDKYEELQSLVYLARYMNEHGYRTRSGNEWSPPSLAIILKSWWYCGCYEYNKRKAGNRQKLKDESEWIMIEDHHIAIISYEQKERVLAILKGNKRYATDHNLYVKGIHVHVFGGLCWCRNCGKKMTSTSSNKNRSWQYSKYLCSTRRRSLTKCRGRSTSDPVLGEFIFNYILNMLNAQKGFDSIHSPADLQDALLTGDAFSDIKSIDQEELNDLYNILSSSVVGNIYGRSFNVNKAKKNDEVQSSLTILKAEKKKLDRALDRLTNLYLYDDMAISEKDYMTKKTEIETKIAEIDEKIGIVNKNSVDNSITDEEFVDKASTFIITQKLTNRNYISYKRLATSVDPKILYMFTHDVIDYIDIYNGKVQRIVFRNGLSQTFIR